MGELVVAPGRSVAALEAEPALEADLEVPDLAVGDVPADLGDLEPVEVAQRPARAGHAVADRRIDAVGGRPDDLGDAVHVVAHRAVLTERRARACRAVTRGRVH